MKQIIGNQRKRPEVIIDNTDLIELLKQPIKKETKPNLEKKVEETKTESPIIKPASDLTFITDENLYKEIIKYLDKTFPNQKNNLSEKLSFDNVMKGSNPYIATAVDMYLKSINSEYRLATQLDLEQNLNFKKDTYNDSGLALRNLTGTNKEQAIYLFNQLKGITEDDFPLFINLRGLNLDSNLNFNLTEESFYKTAECLNWDNGITFSKINKFGLPKEEDKNSSRQIWANQSYALSRCFLDRNSNLNSDNSVLSGSDDGGRVVLAKPRSG